MPDFEVDIVDLISQAVYLEYPGAYISSRDVVKPPKFPTVTVQESSNLPDLLTFDSSGREKFSKLAYTVNVYSNSEKNAKDECKAIMRIVNAVMLKLNGVRSMCRPIENAADPSIYRMVARFSLEASENKVFYRG